MLSSWSTPLTAGPENLVRLTGRLALTDAEPTFQKRKECGEGSALIEIASKLKRSWQPRESVIFLEMSCILRNDPRDFQGTCDNIRYIVNITTRR